MTEIVHELVGLSIAEESLERLFGKISTKSHEPQERLWEINFEKSPLSLIGSDEGNSWHLIEKVIIRVKDGELEYETTGVLPLFNSLIDLSGLPASGFFHA